MTAPPQKPALNSIQRKVWVNDNRHTIPRHLTHRGRVTHICVSKLTIIGSDKCLSPGRRQAIIWTNAGILLIRTSGTNFSEILSEIHAFSFKKMHLKMSSAKWCPFCFGLKMLRMQTIGRIALYICKKMISTIFNNIYVKWSCLNTFDIIYRNISIRKLHFCWLKGLLIYWTKYKLFIAVSLTDL